MRRQLYLIMGFVILMFSVTIPFAQAQEDTQAPELTSFSFSPTTINTEGSAQTVTATVGFTDDLSGVSRVDIGFKSPSGNAYIYGSSTTLASGTRTNGTMQITINFPKYSEQGDWKVHSVYLLDASAKSVIKYTSTLESLGFSTTLLQEGNGDEEEPNLSSLSINPTTINTNSSSQTVSITIGFTDDFSGVSRIDIGFKSPSGNAYIYGSSTTLASGTRTNGTMQLNVNFPRYSEQGEWKVYSVYLLDASAKSIIKYTTTLESLGFTTTLLQEGDGDEEAPNLSSLSFNPTTINTNSSIQTVSVTIGFTDDLSGVSRVDIGFKSPSGNAYIYGSSTTLASGTRTNGTMQMNVNFPRYSEQGEWKVYSVYLQDASAKSIIKYTSALESAGFPTILVNTADNTPPNALCKHIHVQLDNYGSVSISPSDIDDGSNDESGIKSFAIDKSDFNCENVGDNTVILTVTDNYDNVATCEAIVTVEDVTPPDIIGIAMSQRLQVNENCLIEVPNLIELSVAEDLCSSVSWSQDPPLGTMLGVGKYTVTIYATDESGNQSSYGAYLTVEDIIHPTILYHEDERIISAGDDCQAEVPDFSETSVATDNCGYITWSQEPEPGTKVGLGQSVVTVTAHDAYRNTSSFEVILTVIDDMPPTAICKDASITLSGGSASLDKNDIDGGSIDNCSIASKTISKSSFSCDDIGENQVTLTVIDGSDNVSQCDAVVTVHGAIPSVSITSNPETPVTPGGELHTIYLGYGPSSVNLTATGGYSYEWRSNPAGIDQTTQSITVSPTQTTVYTVTAMNEYGCTREASIEIKVVDVRCGNNNNKVKVCHKGSVLCINSDGVAEHLNHGDYLGECHPSKNGDYNETIAGEYSLSDNFPNPFTMTTKIEYCLPENGFVELKVYDIYSREIETLVSRLHSPGHYDVEFDGSKLPSGVYTYCLLVNGISMSRTMVIIK